MKKGIIKDPGKVQAIVPTASIFQRADKKIARSALLIDGSPIYLWVGRLNPNKDPLTVVKAFIRFVSIHPAAKLYMIYQEGDLLDELKRLAGNRKQIVWIGKVEHEKLGDWYNAADVYLSGSHYEGAGTSVIEAISCGCIPILTNILSFTAMTGYGECGYLYTPGDEAQLYEILLDTMKMDMEAEKNRTISYYEKELSATAIARKMEKLMNDLKHSK
jgi:glycosyltransferase involved in cell wall biosynthesis